jgi:hypothetical protein
MGKREGIIKEKYFCHVLLLYENEKWKTSEETSGYVRPERVNTWPNCMTDI